MAISTTSQDLAGTHLAEQENPGLNQVLQSLSLEETIEKIIGGFGWSQIMQSILVAIPSFFDAQQTFISIYADAKPKWHCNFNTTCNSSSNICQLPKSAWSWDETSHNTIISEWGLECATSFITGLPASSCFIGNLVGGFILPMLGDFYLGRKNLLYLSFLMMSTVALMTAFSTNIWMYSSLRFSPRWLFMQGRDTEAISVLKRIASIDVRSLDSYLSSIPLRQERTEVNPYKSMKDLFKRRWALQRILATMVLGFGIGMVFFGMLLGVGNLGFNIYLSVIFNASLLIPSNLLTLFFIARWKRKVSLFAFCTTSGICSIICAVVVELFPTSVRNSATTLARQAIAFGSVFDPVLTSVGWRKEFLSFGIFGLTILLCGFVVIVLPETRGKALCNTMDEQERRDGIIV
uniref:Major facilitator superfamily (MFS) profile domain-containing protein n=1 Tax=Fagus sylvatica TaxID=28930 RepID=A0A2N9GNN1_FAGSY